MGMKGEGTYDDSVWVVKSHYPERVGKEKFIVNKCIVVVRNPLDCFVSLFNMMATQSHDKTMPEHELSKAKELGIFETFV